MASDSEPRTALVAPRSHISGSRKHQRQCCNHGLMGDFMGMGAWPFAGPLYPLKPYVLWGPPRLSGGGGPGPHVIRPLVTHTSHGH